MAKHVHGGQFSNMAAFRRFALAGNSVFTLVSKRTGSRFTFRIRKVEERAPFFIQLMNGPDNTASYAYFACMFGPAKDDAFKSYRYGGRKAKVAQDAASVKGFEWLLRNVMDESALEQVEIWHEGRCGKCRKPLTVPESIESGLGPICAKGGRD